MTVRPSSPARTRAVLGLVLRERQAQEARYGAANETLENGTGPEVQWIPHSSRSAEEIQKLFRREYEAHEDEAGQPTWMHLCREEIAEAFQEEDEQRLLEEVVQAAALFVSWAERLVPEPLDPADA